MFKNICVMKWQVSPLSRGVFHHIPMEVRECTRVKHHEQAKPKMEHFDDDLKITSCYPRIPPGRPVILLWYPNRIPPNV